MLGQNLWDPEKSFTKAEANGSGFFLYTHHHISDAGSGEAVGRRSDLVIRRLLVRFPV